MTLLSTVKEPRRKTALLATRRLSGERRIPVRATISLDQLMLSRRVSAGFPNPSTESASMSSWVKGSVPSN